MVFALGSDGAGAPYLAVPGGGLRRPGEPAHLFMDGTQVFAFTLREVPGNIRAVLERADWTMETVDRLVLHQANAQMIRHLAQKLGATPGQTVVGLAGFGNTSSASIPLALASELEGALRGGPLRLLLSGFGVGWSWGSVALTAGPLAVCEVMALPANPAESAEPDGQPAKGAGRKAIFAECPAKIADP
ncbi:3-oxoacyl-[acyl-carrier-protein] synthase III C-terminal domain-containing protein [Azospirillum argentinense]|uniref:3-oxoacyl-[acyl-carrier-protein] synthase III C-terminal domain-containing protein n=1 Tax=Azospirillum argentinense TaxID=2970906 RepID=UPI0027DC1DCF|nr:3-oxoacyl-[acyl-carrier-protein] synthase III C-terminal domain-containing protein [Azospirillum argentinense]